MHFYFVFYCVLYFCLVFYLMPCALLCFTLCLPLCLTVCFASAVLLGAILMTTSYVCNAVQLTPKQKQLHGLMGRSDQIRSERQVLMESRLGDRSRTSRMSHYGVSESLELHERVLQHFVK